MRKFKLLAYNDDRVLLAEYLFPETTNPSGLGFKQKIETIQTSTVDYVALQQIEKSDIKLSLNFVDPGATQNMNIFRAWLGRYIKRKNVLYYDDGNVERWIDVGVREFDISEKEAGVHPVNLTLKTLSPWYQMKSKMFIVTVGTASKTYPYAYPYAYGGGILNDAAFENSFFENIPLKVRIYGPVVDPFVSLRFNGTIYNTVSFNGKTLAEGEILEIDALSSRILFYTSEDDDAPEDYYNELDKTHDTFLYAVPGENEVVANLDQNEPDAKIVISYVQYLV